MAFVAGPSEAAGRTSPGCHTLRDWAALAFVAGPSSKDAFGRLSPASVACASCSSCAAALPSLSADCRSWTF